MKFSPNYNEYSLAQLRDARSVIDSQKYPERVEEIERLIAEKSNCNETIEKVFDTSKRPKWVWAISIFYAFALVFTLFFYVALFSGKFGLPEGVQQYFANLNWIYWLMFAISSLLTYSAAFTLFLLKRLSMILWLAVLVFSVVNGLYNFLVTVHLGLASGSGLFGMIFGIVVYYAIYAYTKRLETRGYLS